MVVHCFTGGRADLELMLSMGFYIGITGWVGGWELASDSGYSRVAAL